MIKSIFEEDEDEKINERDAKDPLSIIDSETSGESSDEVDSNSEQKAKDEADKEETPALEIGGADDLLELPVADEGTLQQQIKSIENELEGGTDDSPPDKKDAGVEDPYSSHEVPKAADPSPVPAKTEIGVPMSSAPSESTAEAIRNSGLAYSAAIALTGSIVFMLVMGWFADLLLGTTPWGIVTGIVIGTAIGFMQFFRLTSRIINPKPNDFEKVSLLNRTDTVPAGESVRPSSDESESTIFPIWDAPDIEQPKASDSSEGENQPTPPESTKI